MRRLVVKRASSVPCVGSGTFGWSRSWLLVGEVVRIDLTPRLLRRNAELCIAQVPIGSHSEELAFES